MKINTLHIVLMLAVGLSFSSVSEAEGQSGELSSWDFDVYIDDKKVGKHRFELSEQGAARQLQSTADFKYKFLFVTAYTYEHSADERWADNCLVEIAATTNANGKRSQVSGEMSGQSFVVNGAQDNLKLPECVMTFAYWNPEFLEQQRLLNPQTGEYLDVSVEDMGGETLDVRGSPVAATRFKLTAKDLDVTLWYSTNDEWLALESVAKGGRIIRYELS